MKRRPKMQLSSDFSRRGACPRHPARTAMRRRALFPALVCLVLLVAVRTAPGQVSRRDNGSNPSHILLPGGIGDRNAAEDLLAQRLRRSRDLSAVQDLLKKI